MRNMATAKMQRTTLTAKEAAEYLGISYWLITQLVRRKQIPCSRVGKRILFRKEALDIYLSKKENDSLEQIN
jgi:excisionase family DNA binding protein